MSLLEESSRADGARGVQVAAQYSGSAGLAVQGHWGPVRGPAAGNAGQMLAVLGPRWDAAYAAVLAVLGSPGSCAVWGVQCLLNGPKRKNVIICSYKILVGRDGLLKSQLH